MKDQRIHVNSRGIGQGKDTPCALRHDVTLVTNQEVGILTATTSSKFREISH